MTQPIPVPMARDLYELLATVEAELLLLERTVTGAAGMVAAQVLRVRQMQSALRPVVIADGGV